MLLTLGATAAAAEAAPPREKPKPLKPPPASSAPAASATSPALPAAPPGAQPGKLASVAPRVAAPEVSSLLTADGKRVTGTPKLASGKLSLGDDAGVAVDRVIALDCPGDLAGWFDIGVVFANGDVLHGVPRSLQDGKIDFACDVLGPLKLSSADVAAIIFSPIHSCDALASQGDFAGVVLANGDRVKGVPAFVNEQNVGLDTGRKVLQMPRERIRMLVLRPPMPAIGERTRQVVWLANGDRLGGTLSSLSGDGFTLDGPHGVLKLPAASLRAMWSEGGVLTPLDSLTPASVVETPQFDAHVGISIDRGPDGWLSIGGRRYARAIACHATSTCSYDLAGKYSSFVAEVGLASGPGSAVLKVVVDGKTAFDSGAVTSADKPRALCVSVASARELRLVVEAGADGDAVGDRAVWGWPTLIR